MAGKQVVEYFDISMIGEAEVADTAGFAFLEQKIEHSVVHITRIIFSHRVFAAANTVKEHIINVIDLQFLPRFLVHGHGCLATPCRLGEIGEFGGYIKRFAWMTAQGDARSALREALAIGRRRIEIIYTVFDSVIYHAVYHFLVDLTRLACALSDDGWETHHAEAKEGDFIAILRVLAVGHLAFGYFQSSSCRIIVI